MSVRNGHRFRSDINSYLTYNNINKGMSKQYHQNHGPMALHQRPMYLPPVRAVSTTIRSGYRTFTASKSFNDQAPNYFSCILFTTKAHAFFLLVTVFD